MRRALIFLVFVLIIACSEASHTPPPVIGPGVQHNMKDMAAMMRDLHLLAHEGPFTPQQATEVMEMIFRVSVMMKEMSGPDRDRLAPQHEKELKEMRRRLKIISDQLQSQK